jgi:hypothetical protein
MLPPKEGRVTQLFMDQVNDLHFIPVQATKESLQSCEKLTAKIRKAFESKSNSFLKNLRFM